MRWREILDAEFEDKMKDFEDASAVAAELECLALVHADVDAGNARGVLFRPHHFGAGEFLQRQISAHMVVMMMGIEDMG